MPASFKDILEGFEFVTSASMGEHEAFLCKQSGTVYWRSEFLDDVEELPDDIDDSDKYIQIPDRRELDLGNRLVFAFTRQFLPGEFDEVRRIFDRKGAYRRFKALLQRNRALDRWDEFSSQAEQSALREWCEINGIEVSD